MLWEEAPYPSGQAALYFLRRFKVQQNHIEVQNYSISFAVSMKLSTKPANTQSKFKIRSIWAQSHGNTQKVN